MMLLIWVLIKVVMQVCYFETFVRILPRCVVSGSGKIALHVLEKLIVYGALPITVSGNFFFSFCTKYVFLYG